MILKVTDKQYSRLS